MIFVVNFDWALPRVSYFESNGDKLSSSNETRIWTWVPQTSTHKQAMNLHRKWCCWPSKHLSMRIRVPSQYKDHLFRYGISIIKIRGSWDRLIIIMGIPLPVMQRLYILKFGDSSPNLWSVIMQTSQISYNSESKWPKWPWRSRSMTHIFNTCQEYPRMHLWCKFGDSSPNLWSVITQTSQISYNSKDTCLL